MTATNLDDFIGVSRKTLVAFIKDQNKEINNYFTSKNALLPTNVDKLLILAADIHGTMELLEAALAIADASDNEKLNFIYDCFDLDFEIEDLRALCNNKNFAYFSEKYNARELLKNYPLAFDHFLKESEYFIEHMCLLLEHCEKNNFCINKLIKLKCTAIKHLCALEYLIGINETD
ncbi:pkip [Catopsilia pomona nucleopolyhedrovirus]|uniref:Pkip n=1 Tax=Catopsilia pomona nucleopolyhedrovirus TaxID=1850906 RepID=A0A172WZJ3_9ABAC|nr:pkip [Catopsilia pomona nucleopolyhedrovirus]ANF29763.1 pkip [Catopsilia pomona nucleopolyhedrovirus]